MLKILVSKVHVSISETTDSEAVLSFQESVRHSFDTNWGFRLILC